MDTKGRIERGRWDQGWTTVQLTATLEHYLDKMIWKECCLGTGMSISANSSSCATRTRSHLDSAGSVAGQVMGQRDNGSWEPFRVAQRETRQVSERQYASDVAVAAEVAIRLYVVLCVRVLMWQLARGMVIEEEKAVVMAEARDGKMAMLRQSGVEVGDQRSSKPKAI